MPKAIHVREDNLQQILDDAPILFFKLDALSDALYDSTDNGDNLYLITDGTFEERNITYTTLSEEELRRLWKFVDHENPNQFVKIERV